MLIMKKIVVVILLLGLFFSITNCKMDKGPVEPEIDPETISFANDIQPVFNQYCTSCHPSSGNLDLRQGQAYGELVNVPASGYNALRVKPGDPGNSVLYKKIDGSGAYGSNMPLGGSLSQNDIDKIKAWIEQGAPDN